MSKKIKNTDAILFIRWQDSASNHGWLYKEDLDLKPMAISSIGWLVEETEDYIIISSHFGLTGAFNDPMAIPKCCIKEVKEIVDYKID